MPLSNDTDKTWTAWLIADAAGNEGPYVDALLAALNAAQIPKATIRAGTLNMWWRKDSRYIDVTSTMDGSITSTIHVQEYGTSLFVGRAVESYKQSNYYKRMASTAFLNVVDRSIAAALLSLGAETTRVTEA